MVGTEEVEGRVGNRLCTLGTMSNELLMKGTLEEIEGITRSWLKALSPGRAYCLSTDNLVSSWAKLKNWRRMIETGLRRGR